MIYYILTMSNQYNEFLIAKAESHFDDQFIFSKDDVLVQYNLTPEDLFAIEYASVSKDDYYTVEEENTYCFNSITGIIKDIFNNENMMKSIFNW